MVEHLHSDFLKDRSRYAEAVAFWIRLWEQVDLFQRERHGWQQPWLFMGWEQHDEFMDGNPIFSAWTPHERKGIRIMQYAPTSSDLEFDYWLDSFGGPPSDPDSVQDLAIACALSEEAAQLALGMMEKWVSGANETDLLDFPQGTAKSG